MKKTLYLMRHGQTLFNVRRKIQGACDSPLTDLGKKQAQMAREYLDEISFDNLYCSTAERTSDTLEIIVGKDKPYKRLKGIKEMNFGIFEGESEDLNPKTPEGFSTFFVNFGGESAADVVHRMVKNCTDIMEDDDNEVVLAVSHGAACYLFLSAWQDPREVVEGGIPNCCIFKYEYENKKFKLVEVIKPTERAEAFA